jgi:hypothetical protein
MLVVKKEMVVFHRCSKEIQICPKIICPGDLSLLQNANGSYEHFKKIRNHKRFLLRGDIFGTARGTRTLSGCEQASE